MLHRRLVTLSRHGGATGIVCRSFNECACQGVRPCRRSLLCRTACLVRSSCECLGGGVRADVQADLTRCRLRWAISIIIRVQIGSLVTSSPTIIRGAHRLFGSETT
jgi:hypothetical protein